MVCAMARPFKHPKTGVYWFRRAVPEALRAVVGKREWKWTLGTKDAAEARHRHPIAASQCDALQRAAQLGIRPGAISLSSEQIIALGAEWLKRKLSETEGEEEHWVNVDGATDRAFSELEAADDNGTWIKFVQPETERLLKSEGLNIAPDTPSYDKLARTIFERHADLYAIWLRRAGGSADAVKAMQRETQALANAPKWVSPGDPTKTLEWALDGWLAERNPAAKTAYEWRRILMSFGIDRPIAEITPRDVVAFKDRWVGAGQKPNSIDKKLSALRTVLRWAKENHHIAADPTIGIGVVGLKADKQKKKRLSYTKDEARQLLLAARKRDPTHRWLTWLMAATGCRIQEVAQAYASDIKQAGRVWYLDVTDQGDGQTLKTPKARRIVPLHPKLIAEGILEYVKGLPNSSRLFPDITPDSLGNWGGNIDKTWNRWAKKIVPVKSAHCWRHALKTAARNAQTPEDVSDYLTGHVGGGDVNQH